MIEHLTQVSEVKQQVPCIIVLDGNFGAGLF
jgi:hypothetical protein